MLREAPALDFGRSGRSGEKFVLRACCLYHDVLARALLVARLLIFTQSRKDLPTQLINKCAGLHPVVDFGDVISNCASHLAKIHYGVAI